MATTEAPGVPMLLSFEGLEPGLYQVATPDQIQVITSEVTLREADHFWLARAVGNTPAALHTSTAGLRVQADRLGVHVYSRILSQDREYCLAEATGLHLRASGLLEVYRRTKEYNLADELMRAALKEVRKRESIPLETSTALVKRPSEETALALVSTLEPLVKARIMEARLEIQSHRLALCASKGENQVLRYFIAKAGGILKAVPGCRNVTVTLREAVLVRRLTPGNAQGAVDALYGAAPRRVVEPAPAEAAPAAPEPGTEEAERVQAAEVAAEESDNGLHDETAGDGDDGAAEETQAEEEPPASTMGSAARGAGTLPMDQGRRNGQHEVPPRACQGCGVTVPPAVVRYCQTPMGRQRFGGMILCMGCQQQRAANQ